MTTSEIVIIFLILVGAVFMLISAIGIVRLPDVLSRMHAAGKASTVGISAILLGAGFFFLDEFLFYRMLVLIFLIFVTSPISTTALARAVYNNEPALRKQLKHDEMATTVADAPEAEAASPSSMHTPTPAALSPHAAD